MEIILTFLFFYEPPPPPFLNNPALQSNSSLSGKNLLSLPLLQNYWKSFPPFKGGFKLSYYFDFCIFIISDCSDRFLVGGVPTSIYHFSCLSDCPSVCPSITHHVSGTVHHLIVIFGTHV